MHFPSVKQSSIIIVIFLFKETVPNIKTTVPISFGSFLPRTRLHKFDNTRTQGVVPEHMYALKTMLLLLRRFKPKYPRCPPVCPLVCVVTCRAEQSWLLLHLQGQAGWGSGQLDLVVGVPAHSRAVGLDAPYRPLPPPTVLRFHGSTSRLLCPAGCTGTGPISQGSKKSQPWRSHPLPRAAPERFWFIHLRLGTEALTWMDPVTGCKGDLWRSDHEEQLPWHPLAPIVPWHSTAQHGTARQGGKIPSGLPDLILGWPSRLAAVSQAQDQSPEQMPSGAWQQCLPCLLSPVVSCSSTHNHGRNEL